MPYTVETIEPSTTALVVVDMQNDALADDAPMLTPGAVAALPQVKGAIEACRRVELPVVYTTHVHRPSGHDKGRLADALPPIGEGLGLVDGTPGADVHPEIAPRADEAVIKKHRYSAFHGTDLELVLRGLGAETVVVCGQTTEICCLATAHEALSRGYRVVFLSDATGTFDYPDVGQGAMSADDVHRAALVMLAFSTADVVTTDEFIARAGALEHA